MPNWSDATQALRNKPGYTPMRSAARFGSVRNAVARTRGLLRHSRLRAHLAACEARMGETLFPKIEWCDFVRRLHEEGVVFSLKLPLNLIHEIVVFAASKPCYADRRPERGFHAAQRVAAETALGKPILVARRFNAAAACHAIDRLRENPALQWRAGAYLESVPTFVGANLWRTFPIQASQEDRDRHAHLFCPCVDDFRFFKFVFYLADVQSGEGGYASVPASHRWPPLRKRGDRWNIDCYSDAEVRSCCAPERIVEICGPAGTGFAESTLCAYKGLTPQHDPQLLLQLKYALFDYGVMHNRREPAALRHIA